ncbi:MAG: right-handed parallel beta-helix repeat-containing protein [Pirellulaceae bacterium]
MHSRGFVHTTIAIGTRTFLVWIGMVGALAAAEADLFVAPTGNDQWTGHLATPNEQATDGPLATLGRAQQLVRELKAAQPDRDRPFVVAIRGGLYSLGAALSFGAVDSGTESSPVIYQAYGDERPVISGGVPITGWQVDEQGRWYVDLPEVASGTWYFSQLFVNNQRRFRPHLPKEGYYKIAKKYDPSPAAEGQGFDRFGFTAGELDPAWANLNDVEVMPFHQWTASRFHIASLDTQQNIVTFKGHTTGTSFWASFPEGNRYRVVNVREALSQPGEWYLDRPTGRLTYLPQPGEEPDQVEVIAPKIEHLLLIAGDAAQKQWVEYLQFRGLTFAHTNWNLPPNGQAFPQAEINLGAAIAAVSARHVVLENCAVRHTGEYAVGFGPGCQHNRLEGCELVDMGGGGVKIGHALANPPTVNDVPQAWANSLQAAASEEMVVSHHTIRNCTIAYGGRLHPAAVGVWIGHSPHNTIEHNDVHNFYYTGFSVGWTWGYAESHAHHNDIGFNHVYDIGQGVLSDMGGIYTLGVSPGTVIHDNCFHDVTSYDYGGWGLYTDEGSTGIVMKNNLVYRCSRGSFHQHYGKENRVENNILAFAGQQQIQRTRTEEHISFFFEKNIVYWDNGSPLLGSNWKDDNFRMDYNVYFHAGDSAITFPGDLTWEQWQKERGQDQHSLIADPLFENPKQDDFRLKPNSPALQIGFEPFDYTKAGRLSAPTLTGDLPPVPAGFH